MVKWRVGGSSGLLRKVQRVSVCCSMALEFREMWYIHWSYGNGGEWTDSFSCPHFGAHGKLPKHVYTAMRFQKRNGRKQARAHTLR